MGKLLSGWLVSVTAVLYLLAGCSKHGDSSGGPPSGLDLAASKTSSAGKYVADLQRPERPTRINKLESRKILLRTASGVPVHGASIRFSGGMPQHDHGFPTQPQVIPDLASGEYELQGMKFSMPGWWVIRLDIDSPAGIDDVTFNVLLPPSAS